MVPRLLRFHPRIPLIIQRSKPSRARHITLKLQLENTFHCIGEQYLRFVKDWKEYPSAPRAVRSRAEVRGIGVFIRDRLPCNISLFIYYVVFVHTLKA